MVRVGPRREARPAKRQQSCRTPPRLATLPRLGRVKGPRSKCGKNVRMKRGLRKRQQSCRTPHEEHAAQIFGHATAGRAGVACATEECYWVALAARVSTAAIFLINSAGKLWRCWR